MLNNLMRFAPTFWRAVMFEMMFESFPAIDSNHIMQDNTVAYSNETRLTKEVVLPEQPTNRNPML